MAIFGERDRRDKEQRAWGRSQLCHGLSSDIRCTAQAGMTTDRVRVRIRASKRPPPSRCHHGATDPNPTQRLRMTHADPHIGRRKPTPPEPVQRYRACASWSALLGPRTTTSGCTDFRGAGHPAPGRRRPHERRRPCHESSQAHWPSDSFMGTSCQLPSHGCGSSRPV